MYVVYNVHQYFDLQRDYSQKMGCRGALGHLHGSKFVAAFMRGEVGRVQACCMYVCMLGNVPTPYCMYYICTQYDADCKDRAGRIMIMCCTVGSSAALVSHM